MNAHGRLVAALSLLMALTTASACGDSTTGLSDDEYIEIVARLTWSRVQYVDTARDDSLRAAVLDEFGVTGAELIEFADVHGPDVNRMERIWEAVRLRVEELDGLRPTDGREGMLRLDSLEDGSTTP